MVSNRWARQRENCAAYLSLQQRMHYIGLVAATQTGTDNVSCQTHRSVPKSLHRAQCCIQSESGITIGLARSLAYYLQDPYRKPFHVNRPIQVRAQIMRRIDQEHPCCGGLAKACEHCPAAPSPTCRRHGLTSVGKPDIRTTISKNEQRSETIVCRR